MFHIGLHKTATTFLQLEVFPLLEDVCTLTITDPDVAAYVNAVAVTDPIYWTADRTVPAAGFGRRLCADRVNLVSAEGLSGPAWAGVAHRGIDHRSPILTNLAFDFPNADILLVVRRQDEYARSMYAQYVKTGGTATLTEFLGVGPTQRALFPRNRFRYGPYVRELRERFGGSVLVLPYEQLRTAPAEFLSRVGSLLGTPIPHVELRPRNPTRVGGFGLAVARGANHLFRSPLNRGGLLPPVPLRRRGTWVRQSPVRLALDAWPHRPGRAVRQPAAARAVFAELLRECEADNHELSQLIDDDLSRFGYHP